MGVVGVISIVTTLIFWKILPPSRHFIPRRLAWAEQWGSLWTNLTEPGLLLLYCTGALLMGSFVTFFDYICYRLQAHPFHLSQTLVSWIFLLYATGVFSSTWMGSLADRWGRRRVLWTGVATMLAGVLLSLSSGLLIVLAGTALLTFGFFGSHSVASSWVGRRAQTARAQASALYLLFYYFGCSVTSSAAGLVWERHHWPGVVAVIAVLLLVCLGVAFRLAGVRPIAAGPAGLDDRQAPQHA
jgi:YNFM family putative membrane transporter